MSHSLQPGTCGTLLREWILPVSSRHASLLSPGTQLSYFRVHASDSQCLPAAPFLPGSLVTLYSCWWAWPPVIGGAVVTGIDEGPGCSSQLQAALSLTSRLRLLLGESSLVSTVSLSADTTPHAPPTALLSHSPHVRGHAFSPLKPSLGSSTPPCLSSPTPDRIAQPPLLPLHSHTTVCLNISFPRC